MAFNNCRITGTRFDDIGINRALCQKVDGTDFSSFFFKDANKFFADSFTFSFGIGNTCQFRQNRSDASMRMKFIPESLKAASTSSPSFFALNRDQQKYRSIGCQRHGKSRPLPQSCRPRLKEPVRPYRHRQSDARLQQLVWHSLPSSMYRCIYILQRGSYATFPYRVPYEALQDGIA